MIIGGIMNDFYRKDFELKNGVKLVVMGRPNGVCRCCKQKETKVDVFLNTYPGMSPTTVFGELTYEDAIKLGTSILEAAKVRGT